MIKSKIYVNLMKIFIFINLLIFSVTSYADHGIGTGFFITNDGYFLTNAHVAGAMDHKKNNYIYWKNQRIPIHLVYISPRVDISLFKADMTHSPCLQIGTLKKGYEVVGTKMKLLFFDKRSDPYNFSGPLLYDITITGYEKAFWPGNVASPTYSFEPYTRPGNSGSPIILGNYIVSILEGGFWKIEPININSLKMTWTESFSLNNKDLEVFMASQNTEDRPLMCYYPTDDARDIINYIFQQD